MRVCPRHHSLIGKGSPRWQRNSSPSRAPKTGAQLRDDPEEREKMAKKANNPVKPPGRHKHRHTARRNNVQISSANRAWTSEAPSRRKYEILPKTRGLTHERSTTAHRNNVQIFQVRTRPQDRSPHSRRKCGNSAKSEAPVVAHIRARQQLPRTPKLHL